MKKEFYCVHQNCAMVCSKRTHLALTIFLFGLSPIIFMGLYGLKYLSLNKPV